jgi:hypothetical protein
MSKHIQLPLSIHELSPKSRRSDRDNVWIKMENGEVFDLIEREKAEFIVRAVNSYQVMKEALKDTSRQKTSYEYEGDDGDFEEGYDQCIRVARAALALANGGKP